MWRCFEPNDLTYRPHPKSSTVADILKHQLLSERRFFGEFVGTPEPPAVAVPPASLDLNSCLNRMVELARPRLMFFANQPQEWWLEEVPFFDSKHQRIGVFWRGVLYTCHHRTQLTVYLRLMNKPPRSTARRQIKPGRAPTPPQLWPRRDESEC